MRRGGLEWGRVMRTDIHVDQLVDDLVVQCYYSTKHDAQRYELQPTWHIESHEGVYVRNTRLKHCKFQKEDGNDQEAQAQIRHDRLPARFPQFRVEEARIALNAHEARDT